VTKVNVTPCTGVFSTLRTFRDTYFSEGTEDIRKQQKKVTAKKTPNRAGATPLFRLSAAQKVLGVAPALRHCQSCQVFFGVQRKVSQIPNQGEEICH
jgi:hypothetical protein